MSDAIFSINIEPKQNNWHVWLISFLLKFSEQKGHHAIWYDQNQDGLPYGFYNGMDSFAKFRYFQEEIGTTSYNKAF